MGNFLAGVLGVKSEYDPGVTGKGALFGAQNYQNELERLGQVYGAQNVLQQQLEQQAAGAGPTPEQIQYEANVQRQLAGGQGLIASQRGLNPALATRMGANLAASQGAQSAGQAAMLGQTRQIEAQKQLQNLLSGRAGQAFTQQQLMTQANVPTMQTQAAIANANQQAAQGIVGGLLGGIGAMAQRAHGGEIPKYFDGGVTEVTFPEMEIFGQAPKSSAAPAKSEAAQYLSSPGSSKSGFGSGFDTMGVGGGTGNVSPVLTAGFGEVGALGANPALKQGIQGLFPKGKAKSGGSEGAMAGGPMDTLGPMMDAASAAPIVAAKGGAIDFRGGGNVPGKAKVKGDSFKNDTVPAMVSPGEIVIPRSIAQGKDAAKKSADFVAAVLAKKGRRA